MNYSKMPFDMINSNSTDFKYDKLSTTKTVYQNNREDEEPMTYDPYPSKIENDDNSYIDNFMMKDNDLFTQDKLDLVSNNLKRVDAINMMEQNLAEITLPGYLIKLLRTRGKMGFYAIAEEVSKIYDSLRKSDGSKYQADKVKAIRGCLTSDDMFQHLGNGVWSLNESLAKIYENKTTHKIKNLIIKKNSNPGKGKRGARGRNKKIELNDNEIKSQQAIQNIDLRDVPKDLNTLTTMNTMTEYQPQKTIKRYRRKQEKYELVFDVLDRCTKYIKNNQGTAPFLKNPFKGYNGNEAVEDLVISLGPERSFGIFQCFDFFSPIIEDALKLKEKHNSGSTKLTKDKELKDILSAICQINKKIDSLGGNNENTKTK